MQQLIIVKIPCFFDTQEEEKAELDKMAAALNAESYKDYCFVLLSTDEVTHIQFEYPNGYACDKQKSTVFKDKISFDQMVAIKTDSRNQSQKIDFDKIKSDISKSTEKDSNY